MWKSGSVAEMLGAARMYASMVIRFGQKAQHVRTYYEYKASIATHQWPTN
jgi:hypothetical protein